MVDDRAAKMRKLFGPSGLHDNTANLAKTLKALRGLSDDELHDVLDTTRPSLQRGVHQVWEAVRVDIELPLAAGGATKLGIASWSKALPYFMTESANYKDLMRQLWHTKPCSKTNPYTTAVRGRNSARQCFESAIPSEGISRELRCQRAGAYALDRRSVVDASRVRAVERL